MSEWLERFVSSPDAKFDPAEAATAVRNIGTSAVPLLVKWRQLHYSERHRRVERAVWSIGILPVPVREFIVRTSWNDSIDRKHMLADAGFKILGTNAIAALPDMAEQFKSSQDWNAVGGAADALSWMGSNGLPVLLQGLESNESNRCRMAVEAIGNMSYLGADVSVAIPKLTELLRDDSDFLMRRFVMMTLGNLGTVAKPAIPSIEKECKDLNPILRLDATNALMRIAGKTGTR